MMLSPRHNRIAQFALLVIACIAAGLWLLAGRPPARPFGRYAAPIGTPQPVYGTTGHVIAQVTVSNAAVVAFPPESKLPDMLCAVVVMARNDTATTPDTDDIYAQGEWDRPYRDWVVFDDESIRTIARDGTRLKLAAPLLSDYLLPFARVTANLYGIEPVILEKNQSATRLLCYYQYFLNGDSDLPHLPFYHQLAIRARNAAAYAWPAFAFRYNSTPNAEDAAHTIAVQRVPLTEYLQQVSEQFPALVQTLTPAQQEQIGTEIPR